MIKCIIKNFRGLVAEDESLSLGRIGFWVAFFPAIHIWLDGKDIGTYHFYTLGIFLMYNFSKKLPIFIRLVEAWRGESKEEPKEVVA